MFNHKGYGLRGGEDALKLVKLALVFVGAGLSGSVNLRPPVSWQNQDEPLLTSLVVTRRALNYPEAVCSARTAVRV